MPYIERLSLLSSIPQKMVGRRMSYFTFIQFTEHLEELVKIALKKDEEKSKGISQEDSKAA